MSAGERARPPLHVVHLDLERGWRGGERQVVLLLRHLPEAARETGLATPRQVLVCRRGEPLEARVAELGDSRGSTGVEVVPVRNRLEGLGRLPALRRGEAAAGGRGAPDTVVFHAHTGNTVPLAILGAGRRHRSVVTRRLDYPVSGFLFRRAHAVAAISPRVREVLLEAGVVPERLRVIPSGIDLARAGRSGLDGSREARREGLRGELGIGTATPLGLTVAAMVEQKDPLTLVRALARLPGDHHHLWLGDGALREPARSLADDLGVGDRFHAPGFVPDPDPWFAAADLFVLPSRAEGLGTVLLDAYLHRVPVVASRIPATAGLIEDRSSALLFEPGDARGLAGAVRELLDAPELARRLVEEGARRVRDYDAREMARRYLELYRELVVPG